AGLRAIQDQGPEIRRAISGDLEEDSFKSPKVASDYPNHRRNHTLFGRVTSAIQQRTSRRQSNQSTMLPPTPEGQVGIFNVAQTLQQQKSTGLSIEKGRALPTLPALKNSQQQQQPPQQLLLLPAQKRRPDAKVANFADCSAAPRRRASARRIPWRRRWGSTARRICPRLPPQQRQPPQQQLRFAQRTVLSSVDDGSDSCHHHTVGKHPQAAKFQLAGQASMTNQESKTDEAAPAPIQLESPSPAIDSADFIRRERRTSPPGSCTPGHVGDFNSATAAGRAAARLLRAAAGRLTGLASRMRLGRKLSPRLPKRAGGGAAGSATRSSKSVAAAARSGGVVFPGGSQLAEPLLFAARSQPTSSRVRVVPELAAVAAAGTGGFVGTRVASAVATPAATGEAAKSRGSVSWQRRRPEMEPYFSESECETACGLSACCDTEDDDDDLDEFSSSAMDYEDCYWTNRSTSSWLRQQRSEQHQRPQKSKIVCSFAP
uniref:Protein kinase domain-containing protein n=1 Tax=Macrostomum lignano TaxID=282301 RepID=A0A1I8JRT2_9PLAT